MNIFFENWYMNFQRILERDEVLSKKEQVPGCSFCLYDHGTVSSTVNHLNGGFPPFL